MMNRMEFRVFVVLALVASVLFFAAPMFAGGDVVQDIGNALSVSWQGFARLVAVVCVVALAIYSFHHLHDPIRLILGLVGGMICGTFLINPQTVVNWVIANV